MSSTTTVILLSNLHHTRYRISPYAEKNLRLRFDSSSCVSAIEHALSTLQPPPNILGISIIHQAVIIQHPLNLSPDTIQANLEDAGFDVFYPRASQPERLNGNLLSGKQTRHLQLCSGCREESAVNTASGSQSNLITTSFPTVDEALGIRAPLGDKVDTSIPVNLEQDSVSLPHRLSLAVSGMTCAACSASITEAVSRISGVSQVFINVLNSLATMVVENKTLVPSIIETIEDCGFGVELLEVEPLHSLANKVTASGPRTVALQVHGMFCQYCPGKVMNALKGLQPRLTITKPLINYTNPVLEVSYEPIPELTIRTITSTIIAGDPDIFTVSVLKPPTLEARTRAMRKREQQILLRHLLFTFVIAIPTFIIGVVYMNLVPSQNPTRRYFMAPMWSGNASRTQWILFILATPAMFYGAWFFHRRSIKEIKALWRKGSNSPVLRRFTRFGSMNLLVSSGVSVAYFASVTLLALAASQPPAADGTGETTTYFDSVVFLTMFLLFGRYLEAYSKARTADALTALGSLRPAEALLVSPGSPSDNWFWQSDDVDVEKGDGSDNGNLAAKPGHKIDRVSVDLLEIGDVVRVLNGSSPPCDGTIVSGAETVFDESSLTGEAKPMKKEIGDKVFLGTINKSKVVDIRIDTVGGTTMLDRIINVVREGHTRRAPIERVADAVTGVFVPVITLLAITTWVVWLVLGYSGTLPEDYLDINIGGWAVWSLQFAAAVFVVACPCGIGLAAPTALLVGSGVAARHGILVRGGGEAFQEMAQVDVVVFDKTGTLTAGGQPQVSDCDITVSGNQWTREIVLGIAAELESASCHPLAIAIKCYAEMNGASDVNAVDFDEVAGMGLKARFDTLGCTAVIGSKVWVAQQGVAIEESIATTLEKWEEEAKSIVLLAITEDASSTSQVVAVFAITDPVRPEARRVVQGLQDSGIKTWMISGDNETTAKAVARTVGIPDSHVIAGVLPHEKAEKIEWLQRSGAKKARSGGLKSMRQRAQNERCVVAMVGDGINDTPALAAADIGIAIGSGSEVALSSASFILLSSNLTSLLTLADLSRKVLNRVKVNFMWAFMYNLIAVPIAAGVLYPAGHIRLAPAWASLAMALSSVSVVASSLLLKLYRQPQI
ncbi:heavy metal translocatin [Scleroderma citrinum]